MIKFYSSFLFLLFLGIALKAQVTGWSDDFNDNSLGDEWASNPGIYELSETGGELVMTITKQALWDGVMLNFPVPIDLSNNPYASFKMKTDTAVDFRIYLMDKDSLYNKASSDVWVVPGDEYNTYYFNWEGKFQHGADREDPVDSLWSLDSTQIAFFLINADPGGEDLYSGTITIEDFMVGDEAELPTTNAMITSATIGEISATAVKEIPEGTTVSELTSGLTADGDLTMLASGNDGRAGIEAEGTDVVEGSMKVYVTLDGSNPKKYDILILVPALPCYYREDFPSVDGEIDPVWETVDAQQITHNLRDGPIDGPTDLSAQFRTLWDEVSLFFLVEIVDDIKMVDSPPTNPYSDDCVEIWLDLNNSKNSAYLPSETDEFQFVFVRDKTDSYWVDHHDVIEGVDWSWSTTANGYIFEVEMPWATSFVWQSRFGSSHPEFGHKMGFDIHVGDDDDGGDRDVNIGWYYDLDEAWRDPSTLGVMIMKEEIYKSVPEVTSNDFKFRVYPNPAGDQLQIAGNKGITMIEIHNLMGQVVKSIPVQNERFSNINIKDLPNSVYLISVYDTTGNIRTNKLVKK